MGRQLEQADLLEGLFIVHLKASGLWYIINYFRATGKNSWLFKVQAMIIYLIGIPYVFFQVMYIITAKVDIQRITVVCLVTTPTLVLIFKQTFFLVMMDGMCSLYDGLREDFLSSRKSFQSQEIYRRTARFCNRTIALTWSMIVIAEVLWCTLPGYDAGNGRKKPLGSWYPFPYWESPWYEMVFAYEAFLIFWNGSTYILYECFVLIPLFCLCGHFRVLAYQITAIKKKEGLDIACLNQQLFHAFKDFEKLIRFGDLLKEVYNLLVSIVLTVAIVNVTITVLHLMFEDEDYMILMKTSVFLFSQVMELVLICLGSSMIETASSDIHHALYCNDWYLADRKFATATQIMMIRASKPLTLTAMKTYPINLETLLNIFQFIYSTAAVLSKTK